MPADTTQTAIDPVCGLRRAPAIRLRNTLS